MKSIYKYFLHDNAHFELPRGARFLTCGTDLEGTMCFWAEIDLDEKEKETWDFRCIWTGEAFDNRGLEYLGTIKDGLIWHVYRVLK